MRYTAVKRLVDVAVASIGLVVTAPVQAVVACLVRRDLGAPVLFRQVRPGRHGQPFELVKFRTMRTPTPGTPGDDADRLTVLGGLLRSTSLDELPSLWNVVKGDLSLVGPRPLLVEYLDRYTPEQSRRHEVRPGLTGLAQVSGRNAASWDTRLRLDVQYVDSVSWRLDLWIVVRTATQVLRRSGISAEGHATMPPFQGSTARPGQPAGGEPRSAATDGP